ncbi:MAG: hypothetical protein GY816_06385 [Cytophagales bacterium]|nr:hypothetical protein [Cytophagales bacterium]
MKVLLFTILTTVSSLISLSGQTLRYDVIKGNKNLGQMTVKRTLTQRTEEIQFASDVTFRILFAFNHTYSQYEKFTNGKLNWGKALSMLSGRVQKDSKIVAGKDGYKLTLGGVTVPIKEEINYSVSQIYFTEPMDGQKVFSQQFGKFMTFKKVDEHEYLMSSPDGDNYYTYVNGICVNVRVERDFANFNFVMQPESLLAVESKADSLNIGSN